MAALSIQLTDLLKTVGSTRLSLDRKKRQLTETPGFTPSEVFNLMDPQRKGFVALADLYEFLSSNYIYPSERELFILFKDIDSKRLGKIQPTHLTAYLLPNNPRVGACRSTHQKLQTALVSLFEEILQSQRILEYKKHVLNTKYQLDKAFALLDVNGNGAISSLQLRSFMLSQGIQDQDIISSAILQINRVIGSNFGFQEFSGFLNSQSVQEEDEGRQGHTRVLSFGSPKAKSKEPKYELQESVEPKIQAFDTVFETKQIQNEQRRSYLKQQQRIRNKLMQDVMARKRAFLNLRTDSTEPRHSSYAANQRTEAHQIKYSNQKPVHFEEVNVRTEGNCRTSATVSPWIQQNPPINTREQIIKRASSEAHLKIQLIEQQARAKAEERRKLESSMKHGDRQNWQELLIKKNSELEIEKQRRFALEKELSRSKDEILTLKDHLYSISSLNYRDLEISKLGKSTQPQGCQNYSSIPQCNIYKQIDNGKIVRPNSSLGGITKNLNASSGVGLFGDQLTENKYNLEQALRRSRIQRQFARFKLEKELTKSRLPWR